MEFKKPQAMDLEHEELHKQLVKVIELGNKTGEAAQQVADALHAHFEKEDKIAIPPLGLLQELAAGRIVPEMAEVLKMTDALKTELPQMLEEHKGIVAAVEKLIEAARQENKPEAIDFAEKLKLHAQNEEEVSYPTAIVIGEFIKMKLGTYNTEHIIKDKSQ